jgi:hypothetical protein
MTQIEIDNLRRREALLSATLREIIRIGDAAENKPGGENIPPSEAYVGALGSSWRNIEKKARRLLGQIP